MTAETFAHYQLLDRLGAGGMGEVYLAEDLRLHRPVALKMLRAEAAEDQEAAARLLREARVASALNHPNIAVVYEVGEAEREGRRCGYIAMEYVRGRTLAERLHEGPLPVGDAVAIARQVAEALAEAHERGVVHRDVKPGNVVINERGLVKVLDFGLAKFVPPSGEMTATWSGRHTALENAGAVMGTLAYMSPEQARGDEVDARSDVFSLGVLLYEMLSGQRPFQGQNAVGLLEALLRDQPAPLPEDTPVAAALAPLVGWMLEKARERRPSDMREVLRALDEAARGRSQAAGPDADPAVAVMSFANLTRNPEDAWLGTGIAETLAAGLSGLPEIRVVSHERIAEVLRKLGVPSQADDAALAVRLGREVSARRVILGAYQVLGEQVRLTARVVDTRTGQAALTAKVDGTLTGIFELQDRLVGELSAALRGGIEAPLLHAEETHSLEAYESFSKGLLNLRSEGREAIDRAILFLDRAVSLDPGYARAHTQLGAALDLKADYLGMPELSERALTSLDRALSLAPGSADAWRLKGSALITLGRDDEALQAFERALLANPTDASAYSGQGRVHFTLRGDFARAIPCYETALALNPQAGWAALQLAHCAALVHDFPRAEAAARRAVVLQQELLSGRAGIVIVGAWVRLGQAYALQGRYAEAIHEYENELEYLKGVDHALRARNFIELHQRRGEARQRLGDAEGGRADLDLALEAFERRLRLGQDDPATRYYAACAYALRGQPEPALASLEKAAERRLRLTVARARLEPALEGLRGEARFGALLARAPSPA